MPAPRRPELPVRRRAAAERGACDGARDRLGPVVVVVVGYNDYEANYADNIEGASGVPQGGVEHVLWATLRAERQSYLDMNDMILAAAKKHPEITVLRLERACAEPPGLAPA